LKKVSQLGASAASSPRLNPFAFPSDTTQRAILLCIFAVCGSAALYGEFPDASDTAIRACVSQVSSELRDLTSSVGPSTGAEGIAGHAVYPTMARCAELMQPGALLKIAAVGLVLLVAVVLYYLHPRWILRRGRFEPLAPSGPSQVIAELESLAQLVGLSGKVTFVWNPLAAGLPIAFGHRGAYRVALSGAFVTRCFKDPRTFRAIVQHELAHIVSGDIAKTYVALSLSLAFAIVALLPTLLACGLYLATGRAAEAGLLLVYAGFWTAAVVLSGLSLLRVREHYADIQASSWDGVSAIDRALADLPVSAQQGWRRYLRFHPDPCERRAVVGDPGRLFGLGLADAFGIGIAAWSVIGVATVILFPFLPLDSPMGLLLTSVVRAGVTAAVFVVAVGAVGVSVWRGAFASLARGKEPADAAAWLGLAFVAGTLPGLSYHLLQASILPRDEQTDAIMSIRIDAAIVLAVMVCAILVFGWIGGSVSAWFRVLLRRRSPIPFVAMGVLVPTILLLTAFVAVSFVVYLSMFAGVWGHWTFMLYGHATALGVPIIAVSVLAWAIPLAAALVRGDGGPVPSADWVYLDGGSAPIADQDPLHPGLAARIGVVVGLIFWLLWMSLYYRAHLPARLGDAIGMAWQALSDPVERLTGGSGFIMGVAATIAMAVAAVVAAAAVRRLGVVHGLCAASCAGAVILAGDLLFFGISYEFPWPVLLSALVKLALGAAAALPAAILGTLAGRILRRMFAREAARHRDGRRSGLAWVLAATLGLSVVAGMAARVWEQAGTLLDVRAVHVAAEAGDGDAQSRLGEMYASGWSIAQDDALAVQWWTKAAYQGNPAAQYGLAMMYFGGRGVAPDEAAAFEWVHRAAEQDHPDAVHALGWMYAEGRGTFQDVAMARQWFEKAARTGNADAQNRLGVLYALGLGGDQSDTIAVNWLRMAAEQGLPDAQANLGMMYAGGSGLTRDEAAALHWFLLAAEAGHREAQYLAGEMYRTGEGAMRSDAEAVGWLRKAAGQGHSAAASTLETMCESGIGSACKQ
jgi:TPR repeat protein/Zn-dependent protease with chaperone function